MRGLLRLQTTFAAVYIIVRGCKGNVFPGIVDGYPVDHKYIKCAPYNGTVCSDLLSNVDVAFFEGPYYTSVEQLDSYVTGYYRLIQQISTAACGEAIRQHSCEMTFQPCEKKVINGQEYALPRPRCRSGCEHLWTLCEDVFVLGQNVGAGAALPRCGGSPGKLGDNRDNPTDDGNPSIYGKGMVETGALFLDGLQGELVYPERSIEWRLPSHPLISTEIMCYSGGEDEGGRTEESQVYCNATRGVTEFSGVCHLSCPHPIYSLDEYGQMINGFVIMGFIGGIASLALVWFSFKSRWVTLQRRIARSSKKSSSKSRKRSRRTKYSGSGFQDAAGIIGAMYFIFGVLPVAALRYSLPCESRAFPQFLSPETIVEDNLLCILNRGSSLILLGLYQCIALHLLKVHLKLKAALAGATGRSEVIRGVIHKGKLLCICIDVGLCAALYYFDELDPKSDGFHGDLARYSFKCGPRLSVPAEILIVHVPFMVVAVLVAVLALRIRFALRLDALMQGDKNTLQFYSELALLGKITMAMLILLLASTVVIVPALHDGTFQFNLQFVCNINAPLAYREQYLNILSYGSTCAQVEKDNAGKRFGPSVTVQMCYIMFPPSIAVVIQFFYFKLAIRKLLIRRKSGPPSSKTADMSSLQSSGSINLRDGSDGSDCGTEPGSSILETPQESGQRIRSGFFKVGSKGKSGAVAPSNLNTAVPALIVGPEQADP